MNIAITLDIAKPNDVQTVRLRKTEMNSTVLTFVVFEGGVQLDLNEFDQVKFCAAKDDGVVIDALNPAEDGTAMYSLPVEMASMAGDINLAYLALYNTDYIATTQAINFQVLEAVDSFLGKTSYIPEFEEIKEDMNALETKVSEAEAARVEAENGRLSAEQERDTAERERVSSEAERVASESERKEAENARSSAENARVAAETTRDTEEQERIAAEAERVAAEEGRVTAEGGRVEAEAKRVADFAAMVDTMQGLSTYICQDGEYDPDSLQPTLSGVPNMIYLVPTVGGTSDNEYLEWMFLNDSWEKIGTTGTTVTPISTDTIDSITSGTSETGSESLNTTGLSYFFTKLKGLFAAIAHKHSASDITSGTLPIESGGTGANNAADAANNLEVKSIGGRTLIPNYSDLNELVTIGNYSVPVTTHARTIMNTPYGESVSTLGGAFILTVYSSVGNPSQNYITQEYEQLNITDVYKWIRKTYDRGESWGDWIKVASEIDLTSYLPLTGGTLTGDLRVGSLTSSSIRAFTVDRLIDDVQYRAYFALENSTGENAFALLFQNNETGGLGSKNYIRLFDNRTELLRPLTVSSGGTGANSAKAAQHNLLSGMNSATDTPTDASKLVFAYDASTSNNGAIFKRPLSSLWTWIKSKADSIYAALNHTHAPTECGITIGTEEAPASGTPNSIYIQIL